MRKALKKLRYQVEFFAPLFSARKTKRFVTQLKELQDVFGYVNDARMASKLIEIQRNERAGDEAAVAAGVTVGTHRAEARHVWDRAHKAWKKLERQPRFWC
jgi:CHAD domain-containing protein